MRASKFLIATLRETPADAEVISHQLMLRAGMIRKLASGLYTWLPLGKRVLNKVEKIIREEMDKQALEVMMPMVQPAELWKESARYEQYGPELLRISDRNQRPFVLGPTHEEVVTDLVRHQIRSYKQLPLCLYQIQTKFRDEIRPRFGIMRAREFLMKDAYSFHSSAESLQQSYDQMYATYCAIFQRLGLNYRAVDADTGSIGGSDSHEFHVLAQSGEDAIAFSSESDYAANVEKAEAICLQQAAAPSAALTKTATPNKKTIEDVSAFLQIDSSQFLKTLIVHSAESTAENTQLLALVLRGDHTLNEIKAEKHPQVAAPIKFATDAELLQAGLCKGFIGPIGLDLPIIVDRSAAAISDFGVGANEVDQHYVGANWQRDLALPATFDIRNVEDGDPSPDGHGVLQIKRGIEVGHIFQLGNKYSQALKATVLDEEGKAKALLMGCYGIGVTRVVSAAIEQNFDDKGILWPQAIAPFDIAIVPMNAQKSEIVRQTSEQLYLQLQQLGYDVLLDDRNERPGVKFADIELIGIPHRVVIGEKSLAEGCIEYKTRSDSESQLIDIETLIKQLTAAKSN